MRTPTDNELREFIRTATLELQGRSPEEIAERTGVEYDPEGKEFCVKVLGREFNVSFPEFQVHETAIDHHEGALWLQSLILLYFRNADGWPESGEWISMRQLPGGLGYDRTFQSYSGDELARAFKDDVAEFTRVSRLFGGRPGTVGDASFVFYGLPRLPLMVVYSAGEDDFPAEAKVLFDSSATHYLPTDALAILGGRLCKTIVQGLTLRRTP